MKLKDNKTSLVLENLDFNLAMATNVTVSGAESATLKALSVIRFDNICIADKMEVS